MNFGQVTFRSVTTLVVLSGFLCAAKAQDSIADLPSFRQGCVALEDGRFETAANLFQEAWQTLESGESGDAEKDFVASRLLESFYRNGSTAEALLWLNDHALISPSDKTRFWAARVYENEGIYEQAALNYKTLKARGVSFAPDIEINFAVCLARINDRKAALQIIESLPSPATAAEALRMAQITALSGKFEAAIELLETIEDLDSLPAELRLKLMQTRLFAFDRLNRKTETLKAIRNLVELAKNPEEALTVFLMLEETLQDRAGAELKKKLSEWSRDSELQAAPTCTVFEVLWFTPQSELESKLDALQGTIDDLSLQTEIRLRLDEIRGETLDRIEEKKTRYRNSDLVARYDFLRTASLYRAQQFEAATETFLDSAKKLNGESRSASLYNAAVSALQADNVGLFSGTRNRIKELDPTSVLLPELKFLEGLHLASIGDSSAFEVLSQFAGDNPDHIHFVEAQLAMAEIQLNQAPARPKAARDIFEQLQTRALTLPQQERLDYLMIWAALTGNDTEQLITSADEFLSDWPNSVYFPEVCMLAASRYYETKRRKLSKERFSLVVSRFPNSEYAPLARFFAAKSTPGAASTISEWRSLIEEGGELTYYAKHELGLLLLSLNRFEEARGEFTSLASEESLPEALKYAAQADLGFTWYAEALSNDKNEEQLKEAANVFTELSSSSQIPPLWRYSSAVRRGKCLEALGSDDVALEIYQSIVKETGNSESILLPEMSARELNWIYRAGFSAITLLREREDWASAIRIADSLAAREGSRSFEAARLARSLRLKHWVWE